MQKEVTEAVRDSALGNDSPLEKTHPKTTAGLVFLTYPALIIAAIVATFLAINFLI